MTHQLSIIGPGESIPYILWTNIVLIELCITFIQMFYVLLEYMFTNVMIVFIIITIGDKYSLKYRQFLVNVMVPKLTFYTSYVVLYEDFSFIIKNVGFLDYI